jgi:hypothetical protein
MNQLPEKLYLGQNLKQYVMKEAVIYKHCRGNIKTVRNSFSERLFFNANSAILWLYHGETTLMR